MASKREGLVYGMPEPEYHAPKDELSSTGAKLLLQSPAKFKHVVIDGHRPHKDAWDLGTIIHGLVLGTGWDVEELDYPDFRTNAAKEARDKARDAGKIPVLKHKMTHPKQVAESVLAHPTARGLLEAAGHPEVSAFGTCPETGVRLRARFDRLPTDLDVAVDLKTVGKDGGAETSVFAREIFNFGYDVQAGQYVDTIKYAAGREVDFAFIAVETTAPYLVNVVTMTHDYLEMGRTKSMEARRRYAHGMETGEWPGYSGDIKRVEPPMYAVYDFQDNYEGGEMQI